MNNKKIICILMIICLITINITTSASARSDSTMIGVKATSLKERAAALEKYAADGMTLSKEEVKIVNEILGAGDPKVVDIKGGGTEDPPKSNTKNNNSNNNKNNNSSNPSTSSGNSSSATTTSRRETTPGGAGSSVSSSMQKSNQPVEKDIVWKNKIIGSTRISSKFEVPASLASKNFIPLPDKWIDNITKGGWGDSDKDAIGVTRVQGATAGWVVRGDPKKTHYIDVKVSERFTDTSSVNTKYWEWNLGKANHNGKNKVRQNRLDIKICGLYFRRPENILLQLLRMKHMTLEAYMLNTKYI